MLGFSVFFSRSKSFGDFGTLGRGDASDRSLEWGIGFGLERATGSIRSIGIS